MAIDIDENSLKNARENVVLNNLNGIIEVRKSNLFRNLKENEKFDLMISQLPFADVKYKSPVGHFLFDTGFKLHERLLKNAKDYLTKEGKLFIPSGDVANEKKLVELIRQYRYDILSVAEEDFQNFKWKLFVLKKGD